MGSRLECSLVDDRRTVVEVNGAFLKLLGYGRDDVIERPFITIAQDSTGTWNFRKLFPSRPPGPKAATRNFGDYIVINNADLRGARLDSRLRQFAALGGMASQVVVEGG